MVVNDTRSTTNVATTVPDVDSKMHVGPWGAWIGAFRVSWRMAVASAWVTREHGWPSTTGSRVVVGPAAAVVAVVAPVVGVVDPVDPALLWLLPHPASPMEAARRGAIAVATRAGRVVIRRTTAV